MNRDVIEGVSVGDLVFLGSALLSALVVSFVVRVIFRMIRGRIRRENPDSIRANLIDDVDGALSLQIILVGLYVGIIWQPSLSDYQSIITAVYAIVSVLVLSVRGNQGTGRRHQVESWARGRWNATGARDGVLGPNGNPAGALLHRCDGIPYHTRPAWHIHRSTAGRPRHRRPGRSPRTAGNSHKYVRRPERDDRRLDPCRGLRGAGQRG